MKRLGIVSLVTTLVVGLPLGSEAMAAEEGAVCVFNYDAQLSPGLSMAKSSASWSGGKVSVNCLGTVNGSKVDGPGVIQGSGELSGTCAQGSGTGMFAATIPTVAGPVEIVLPVSFAWVGAVGTFDGPRFSGVFQFLPIAGDCLTAPVTRMYVVQQGMVTSS